MASSQGTDADKSSLRSGYLAARRTIPASDKSASDQQILSTLRRFPIFAEATFLLSYVSYDAEVDTRALIEGALSGGMRVAVPRCVPGERRMEFCEISSLGDLVPGFKGILEPAPDATALTAPELVGSVCLVPGLVFDADGHRVGYGGGYYDRFLQFYPGDKIALARTTQLSSNPLPIEETDVPVDFIVTESQVWSCR